MEDYNNNTIEKIHDKEETTSKRCIQSEMHENLPVKVSDF